MEGMPPLYANLSKNATIPRVAAGALWSDEVNGWAYLYGGETTSQGRAWPVSLYAYDVWYDKWYVRSIPDGAEIPGVSHGAATSVSERGEGYYYGGWCSSRTDPGIADGVDAQANNELIRYNYDTDEWTTVRGPDEKGRAEGVMVYIPAGDGGLLIYFGGVVDETEDQTGVPVEMFDGKEDLGKSEVNGTTKVKAQRMDEIFIYDVVSTKWYRQNATGQVPENRRRFCAGVTWADDQSTYNIYLFGGLGFGDQEAGYGDVYALTLPTFTWIKLWPGPESDTPHGPFPHHSLSCNVVRNAQMIIIGGWFTKFDGCDEPKGAHGLDMGKQNKKDGPDAYWDTYKPQVTKYVVPDDIRALVGGNEEGGATRMAPEDGFGEPDLAVLATLHATVASRTASRTPPFGTATETDTPSGLSTGEIAGIAVGITVAAVGALAAFAWFVRGLYMRKRREIRREKAVAAAAMAGRAGGTTAEMQGGAWSPAPAYHDTPNTTSTTRQQQQYTPDVYSASRLGFVPRHHRNRGSYGGWTDGGGRNTGTSISTGSPDSGQLAGVEDRRYRESSAAEFASQPVELSSTPAATDVVAAAGNRYEPVEVGGEEMEEKNPVTTSSRIITEPGEETEGLSSMPTAHGREN